MLDREAEHKLFSEHSRRHSSHVECHVGYLSAPSMSIASSHRHRISSMVDLYIDVLAVKVGRLALQHSS